MNICENIANNAKTDTKAELIGLFTHGYISLSDTILSANIPLAAKYLYIKLCQLRTTASSTITMPPEKILLDSIGISRKSYYTNRKKLEQIDCISVNRRIFKFNNGTVAASTAYMQFKRNANTNSDCGIFPRQAFYANISRTALVVYAALCSITRNSCRSDRYVCTSHTRIQKMLHLSNRAVNAAISELKMEGYILTERTRDAHGRYEAAIYVLMNTLHDDSHVCSKDMLEKVQSNTQNSQKTKEVLLEDEPIRHRCSEGYIYIKNNKNNNTNHQEDKHFSALKSWKHNTKSARKEYGIRDITQAVMDARKKLIDRKDITEADRTAIRKMTGTHIGILAARIIKHISEISSLPAYASASVLNFAKTYMDKNGRESSLSFCYEHEKHGGIDIDNNSDYVDKWDKWHVRNSRQYEKKWGTFLNAINLS